MTGVDGVSDQVRDADRDLKAIWGAIGGLDRKIKGVSLSIHQAVQEFKKTIEDDRRRAAIQTPMGDRTVTEPYSHRQNHRGQNQQFGDRNKVNQTFQGVPYQKLSGVFEHDLCNFKKRVPSFNGTVGTNHVLDWIDVVDDYFDETNPPEALKCKLAATKLKGEARNWWMELQSHRLSEGKCLISSWPKLSELLYCRFSPTNCSTKLPNQREMQEGNTLDFNFLPATCLGKVPLQPVSSNQGQEELINSGLNHISHKKGFMSSSCSIICLSQATTAAEVPMKFIEGNKEEKSTKDSKKDDEHSGEANEINGEAEAVIHTKQEEGHELVKFLQSSSFLPAKCSTNFPSESYSSRWNEVRELGLLDLVKGTNMVETHEKAVLCIQTLKLKDHQLSGLLDFELNTNRVLIGHMQEESDSEAAKLKLEYKVTFMNNGTLPNDVSVLFYLPRSFRELDFVSKGQNLKLIYGGGSNIRLEGIVWLIRVVVILKLHFGRNKHMRYLIFGERMVPSYSIDEIGLLSFDPGGNPIAQKAGNYLFTSYGILLKNEATNDGILLNITRLNGESEANEPTVVIKKELVFGISGFKGSGLLYVGNFVKKMDRNLQLIIIPHSLINSPINKCSSEGVRIGEKSEYGTRVNNATHEQPRGRNYLELTDIDFLIYEILIILTFDPGGAKNDHLFGGREEGFYAGIVSELNFINCENLSLTFDPGGQWQNRVVSQEVEIAKRTIFSFCLWHGNGPSNLLHLMRVNYGVAPSIMLHFMRMNYVAVVSKSSIIHIFPSKSEKERADVRTKLVDSHVHQLWEEAAAVGIVRAPKCIDIVGHSSYDMGFSRLMNIVVLPTTGVATGLIILVQLITTCVFVEHIVAANVDFELLGVQSEENRVISLTKLDSLRTGLNHKEGGRVVVYVASGGKHVEWSVAHLSLMSVGASNEVSSICCISGVLHLGPETLEQMGSNGPKTNRDFLKGLIQIEGSLHHKRGSTCTTSWSLENGFWHELSKLHRHFMAVGLVTLFNGLFVPWCNLQTDIELNLTRGRAIPWEGWKVVDNTNTEGFKKTLKLFFKLVNGRDPPKYFMVTLEESTCGNNYVLEGKFISIKLYNVTISSCLSVWYSNEQSRMSLKLFHDVVNGLDPPMDIDGVCWVVQWISSCPGLSMLQTLVFTRLLTNQHLIKFNSRTSLFLWSGMEMMQAYELFTTLCFCFAVFYVKG